GDVRQEAPDAAAGDGLARRGGARCGVRLGDEWFEGPARAGVHRACDHRRRVEPAVAGIADDRCGETLARSGEGDRSADGDSVCRWRLPYADFPLTPMS